MEHRSNESLGSWQRLVHGAALSWETHDLATHLILQPFRTCKARIGVYTMVCTARFRRVGLETSGSCNRRKKMGRTRAGTGGWDRGSGKQFLLVVTGRWVPQQC